MLRALNNYYSYYILSDSFSQVSFLGKATIGKTKLKDMSHRKVSTSNSCKLDRNLQTSSNIYVLQDILKREDLQSRAIIWCPPYNIFLHLLLVLPILAYLFPNCILECYLKICTNDQGVKNGFMYFFDIMFYHLTEMTKLYFIVNKQHFCRPVCHTWV